ncbi:TPA: 50S ribosomal protein L37e [archaeon]|nr:50S ribosomal protein L37e [Candidatus Naiadarchaeales archaeon SRR2090153.bin461]
MKGTPSRGKHTKRSHVRCRRCGYRSMHTRKQVCAHCGFGKSAKLKQYSWQSKRGGRYIK